MGRSAKLHKRSQKKTASTSTAAAAAPAPSVKPKPSEAAEQKKKAGFKAKAKPAAAKRRSDGPVLGGADYVELMLGSRRRAAEEAGKLPMDED